MNASFITPPPLSAAYTWMRQWIGSRLVKNMACRLLDAKPLSKPMLGYCYLALSEQMSVNVQSKFKAVHSRKCMVCETGWVMTGSYQYEVLRVIHYIIIICMNGRIHNIDFQIRIMLKKRTCEDRKTNRIMQLVSKTPMMFYRSAYYDSPSN